MPWYYFDAYNAGMAIRDGEGDDLEGLDAAQNAAAHLAVEIARDRIGQELLDPVVVEVRDAQSRRVLKLSLSLVVERYS